MKKIAYKFPGTIFLVIGNSGSGKDSIINGVIKKYPSHLKQIHAPKRFITRPPSETEKNISITEEKFKDLKEKGKLALTWHIYGLYYGIPIEIEDWLKAGNPILLNVSRRVVKPAREKYKNLKVVFIYVPLEITIDRLKGRGRETTELLQERIERAKNNQLYSGADLVIDNSGKLDDSINQLLEFIISIVSENHK
ncbi:MAG: phosphonate metabolism protein/1,5-bisphosphokinase (PRPP-forming) PhnN [Candidatus Hodarchaeota archaeon]